VKKTSKFDRIKGAKADSVGILCSKLEG